MRIDERLLKTVVYLGLKSQQGFVPIGTAFLLSVTTDEYRFDHIVTARHNLDRVPAGTDAVLRVNRKDGGSPVYPAVKREHWHFHPQDKPHTDIAVCTCRDIGIDGGGLDVMAIGYEEVSIQPGIIEQLDIGAGSEVVTVGMFTKHLGDAQNVPVARVGNIAAMRNPAEPVPTSNGPTDAYLVEMRSIGGLSGSPVYLQSPLHRIKGNLIVQAQGVNRQYLLGVMQGYYGLIEPAEIAGEDEAGSSDMMNAGIGVVVPIDKVIEIINKPELLDRRKEIAAQMKAQSGHRNA